MTEAWEIERAFNAAEDAMRDAATHAVLGEEIPHRKGFHLVCELPPGTSVKALDGCLVACHPNHNPIFIGLPNLLQLGKLTPHQAPSQPRGGTSRHSGIVGQRGES